MADRAIPDFHGEVTWVTPWDGLLVEVRRSAYRVAWVDARIEELLVRERQLVDEAEYFGSDLVNIRAELRRWLVESRNERKHLAATCDRAIRAGFVERSLQQAQLEARTIARVLGRSLEPLELDEPRRELVARAMREALEDVSLERQRAVAARVHGGANGHDPSTGASNDT